MPRPLSFDPQQVRHQAMLLFWKSGYAETSMSQLTEALGINKFSLYKQFGSKNELYLQSLAHYQKAIYLPLLKPLRTLEGKKSIVTYLTHFSEQVSRKGASAGCFINNTLLAGPTLPDESRLAARSMAAELRNLLSQNFDIARQENELQAPQKDCLNFTLMTIQALLNTRRTLGPFVMQGNVRFFIKQLQQW